MRQIDRIIIHCADTPNGRENNAADIDLWHRERGWDCIGYHNVICIDGTVERGRPYFQKGAHARGYNGSSLGICLIGRDKFTQAQWDGLLALVKDLCTRYGIDKVQGHRDVDDHKTCPNFSVADWIEKGPNPDNILEV